MISLATQKGGAEEQSQEEQKEREEAKRDEQMPGLGAASKIPLWWSNAYLFLEKLFLSLIKQILTLLFYTFFFFPSLGKSITLTNNLMCIIFSRQKKNELNWDLSQDACGGGRDSIRGPRT